MPATKAMPSPTSAQPSSQPETAAENSRLKLAAASNVLGDPSVDGNDRRTKSGKFSLAQLRQTDGIVPLQSGTNQFDSQRGKTSFGMPRNTQTRVEFADGGKRWSILSQQDTQIRLQSGTNQFDSQRGMTGFGCPRDVKGKHLKRIWELEFPEEAVTDQVPINQAPQQGNQQRFQQQNQQQRQQQTPQQVPPQQQQQLGRPAPQQAAPNFK